MLVLPLVLGLRAGSPDAAALLIVSTMTLLFFARYALVPLGARLVEGGAHSGGAVAARLGWGAAFLAGSLLAFAAAFAAAGPAARPPALRAGAVTVALGLVHSALVLAGRHRAWWAEFVGMAGLASAAPLVIAVSGHPLDRRAIGIGALCLVYFVSTLAYIRAWRAMTRAGGGPAGRAAAPCVAAHALLAAVLAALWETGFVPGWALLGFVPVAARTAWGLLFPPRSVRTLGWREVAVAVLFTLLALPAL
jgi:hypothetical protein